MKENLSLSSVDDIENISHEIAQSYSSIFSSLKQQIVGQDAIIEKILITLFSKGHSLLIGVPGLAKTKLITKLSEVLELSHNRVQFTPDLMPSDITGTEVLRENSETGKREFHFIHGPIFAHLILADEINRATPKTQSALLQAMQEKEVTYHGITYPLPNPFHVFATQNPIEQEGTYLLPEAQLDRFMSSLIIDYPSYQSELSLVKITTQGKDEILTPQINHDKLLQYQQIIEMVAVPQHVLEYCVSIVRSTRPSDKLAPEFVKEFIEWGAGPRASQYIIKGAKARALLNGRTSVEKEDIRNIAPMVLYHRIMLKFHASAQKITVFEIIKRIIESSPDIFS